MLRAKSTRKRVASAVARECAEMSRASVESLKSEPEGKPRQFRSKPTPVVQVGQMLLLMRHYDQ
jgi:hypothetical protein